MGFKLTIEQGKGRGQAFEFDAEEITFGRTDENDVVVAENGVSRQHARISFDGERWSLEDLGSANGTTLNGAKVASEVLEDGDRIGVGAVVFKFEPAQATGAATRIVSLEQAEEQAKAKRAGKGSKTSAPAAEEAGAAGGVKLPVNPRVVRLALLGIGVVIAVVLGATVLKGKSKGGLKACPGTIDIDAAPGHVFGRGVDADCEASKSGLRFGFNGVARSRAILHYAPFYVKSKGDFVVLLNGKKIDEPSAAPTRKASRQALALPDGAVKTDGTNEITFQSTKGSDATWGVERVELEVIALTDADVGKAQEAYLRGTKLYREKNVAAPNLYNAWSELREARRYMEGLPTKPDMYNPTLDLIRDIEKELDVLCKRQLFAATREAKYGRYDGANEAYKFILAAFPGDAHPCRHQAEQGMYIEGGEE